MAELNGFLVIDKPKNWTSFDVVAKLRTISGQRSIGHTGTLDPFATGVLVITFGQARFLAEHVQEMDKLYRGRIKLGQTSDTDDVEGKKSEVSTLKPPTEKDVAIAIKKFTGSIEQIPPDYSALKVQGRKMYELARKGLPINKKPRSVMIYELSPLAYSYPYLDIEAKVSKGTYIRALARDLGEELKVGGYLEELVRHSLGLFNLEDAHDIGDLNSTNLEKYITPPQYAVEEELKTRVSDHDLERLAHGERVSAPSHLAGSPDIPFFAIVNKQGEILMIAEYNSVSHDLKSKKIFDISLRR